MSRWTFSIFVLLAVLGTAAGADAYQDLPISAKSYVIMDADSGKVLLSRNPTLRHPPASTLKVCTALIALNTLNLDDVVPVSRYAASAPRSKVYLKPGEIYSVRDILYAVLLSSGNDAARAIAERVCGTEERFGKYMTQRVRKWGAYRTNFENASGLPAEDQYTTARDLALIFRRAMAHPTLARIMTTKTHMIKGGRNIRNHNRFLFTTPYAVAGKTGYIRASKHTYVGMFEHRGRRLIISVLGSRSKDKWADRRVLIEKGFALCGVPIAKLPALEERLRPTRWGYALCQPRSRQSKKFAKRKSRKKRLTRRKYRKKRLARRKYRKKRSRKVARRKSWKKRSQKLASRKPRQRRSATAASLVSLKNHKKVRKSGSRSKHRARSKKRKKTSGRQQKIMARIRRAQGS